MPFAGYGDFDDCVSNNSDKKDPEAYCGAIKHRVEKALETGQISDELAALITMSDNADVSEEATQHWETRVVHLEDSPASEEELNGLSQKTDDVSRRETDSFVCWTAASQNQTIYKAVEADEDGDTPRGNAEEDGVQEKGEFETSVLGTDGVPGDRQSFESFLDALVDAGADVFTIRNGELQVWPDDSIDDADPRIQVVGIPDSEVLNILDRFNLEFMKTPEVENASDN